MSLCWYNCWGCCRRRRRCGTRLSCRRWDGCWLWSLVFAGAGSYEQYDDCRGQHTQEVTVFLYLFGKPGQLGILNYRTVHRCGTSVPLNLHDSRGDYQCRLYPEIRPQIPAGVCSTDAALGLEKAQRLANPLCGGFGRILCGRSLRNLPTKAKESAKVEVGLGGNPGDGGDFAEFAPLFGPGVAAVFAAVEIAVAAAGED